mgnify:CR=1 FL=1
MSQNEFGMQLGIRTPEMGKAELKSEEVANPTADSHDLLPTCGGGGGERLPKKK